MMATDDDDRPTLISPADRTPWLAAMFRRRFHEGDPYRFAAAHVASNLAPGGDPTEWTAYCSGPREHVLDVGGFRSAGQAMTAVEAHVARWADQ